MKDRLTYSPNHHHYTHQYDIHFKKSPLKYVEYDSPLLTQHFPSKDNTPSISNFKEFDNLKKLAQETSALRQTMNLKYLNKLQKNHVLQFEEQKVNKLNDFLRQTTKFKTPKTYSQTLIPDHGYSGQFHQEQLNRQQKNMNNVYNQRYQFRAIRRGFELINDSKSLQQYERLNQQINRNKQLIQQLRKNNKHPRDSKEVLKNLNNYKTSTYLHIQNQNQKEDLGFKKVSKESNYFLTPKVDKPNYQSRFNSSPFIQHAKSIQKSYEEPTVSSLTSVSSIKRKISAAITDKNHLIDQFVIHKKLGQGKFGIVHLAKHKKTNGTFALKKIPKALIKSNMMVDQLALEIRIQSCLKNANILEMHGTFDDKTHLYIVLEYMDGGTLYQKLKREKLGEKQASIIIKQIASAIDYLHDMGIAHRDLKPQNIVISNNVYKLCDFGWAAICNQRRKTYCGTFDYVAPQILQGVEYDMAVDLWCLGVLTFQILTGKAPFYHISRKETKKRILNVQNYDLIFPEGISEIAKDFIDKLIRKNPEDRIKASQALKHPFLKLADQFN